MDGHTDLKVQTMDLKPTNPRKETVLTHQRALCAGKCPMIVTTPFTDTDAFCENPQNTDSTSSLTS